MRGYEEACDQIPVLVLANPMAEATSPAGDAMVTVWSIASIASGRQLAFRTLTIMRDDDGDGQPATAPRTGN